MPVRMSGAVGAILPSYWVGILLIAPVAPPTRARLVLARSVVTLISVVLSAFRNVVAVQTRVAASFLVVVARVAVVNVTIALGLSKGFETYVGLVQHGLCHCSQRSERRSLILLSQDGRQLVAVLGRRILAEQG